MVNDFLQDLDAIGMEPTDEQGSEWFLGYDATCSRCESLQEIVKDVAGGSLLTISLHDPIVKGWRTEVFGPGAPWAPTLFRIREGKVQAWVGKKVAVRLATLLGPRKAWQLASAIANVNEVSPESESGLDRRTFLKGLSGVAAGVALLNVTQLQAEAQDHLYCGVNWTGLYGNYPVLSGGAECRECPTTASVSQAFLAGGSTFYYRGYTSNGQYVGSNPYWFRSSGPIGCWVSGTRLP